MTPLSFAYWLQGAFEIDKDFGKDGLSAEQVQIIKDHLALVFKHEAGVPNEMKLEPTLGNHEYTKVVNIPPSTVPFTPYIGPGTQPFQPDWTFRPYDNYFDPTRVTVTC
jgi:hypothetical protein